MNTEQKREHFARLREAQVILAKVNRELAATRETAERIKEKHGRDSERLLIDLETIEHYLVKLRDQLEDITSPFYVWERCDPQEYVIMLDNENGDRFYYEGPSSWDEASTDAFVFDAIGEAKGVARQLAKVEFPWNCQLHIVERASGIAWFSTVGTKENDLQSYHYNHSHIMVSYNSSDAEKMNNIEYFSKAARHNSGKHFLDSGGANGRHWQKPNSPKDLPAVTVDQYGATIETAHLLDAFLEVDRKVQAQFDKWAALPENERLSWFEAGETFATKVLGLEQLARDNTYNSENDLSQVFIWEVYALETKSDWLFTDDDTLTVVYIHTGCDVRGGYSFPLFCRPKGEYSIPIDLQAEYYAFELKNTPLGSCDISERWQCGWSSYPWGQVEEDCKRMFFPKDREPDEFLVALKDGGAARVQASFRHE